MISFLKAPSGFYPSQSRGFSAAPSSVSKNFAFQGVEGAAQSLDDLLNFSSPYFRFCLSQVLSWEPSDKFGNTQRDMSGIARSGVTRSQPVPVLGLFPSQTEV